MTDAAARIEDRRLVTGAGRNTGDLNIPGQICGAFLQSPIAHASLRRVDPTPALAMSGALDILAGARLAAEELVKRAIAPLQKRDGSPAASPNRTTLASDQARFAGGPIALVVVETPMQAADAAEPIEFVMPATPLRIWKALQKNQKLA